MSHRRQAADLTPFPHAHTHELANSVISSARFYTYLQAALEAFQRIGADLCNCAGQPTRVTTTSETPPHSTGTPGRSHRRQRREEPRDRQLPVPQRQDIEMHLGHCRTIGIRSRTHAESFPSGHALT
jgi:hypothetical protein